MIYFPACATCDRFRRRAPGFTCDAFPAGIPAEIVEGRNPHTAAYPGDRGMQYTPRADAPESIRGSERGAAVVNGDWTER